MSKGDNVERILDAIGPFWENGGAQNGGWDESRGAQVFLCGNPYDLSATSQRPIFIKFGHKTYLGVSSMNPETFSKIFTSGSFAPKI